MKILKNNKGSTLFITIIFIFVVSLMLVGLHTTMYSLMTKVSVTYDDKESYLSARSVALTVAEYIEDLYDDEVADLEAEALTATTSLDIASENTFLLAIEGLTNVGDTLELNNISFNSNDFTLGETYKALITKTASGLLISVESTVDGAVEEVAISLNSEVVEIEVSYETTTSVQITGGYLRGFYLDIMPYCGSLTYAEDAYDNDDAMLCVESSFIYVNPTSYLGMKSDMYCHGDVILVANSDKKKSISGEDFYDENSDNIDFCAEGYIYLNSITLKYVDLQSNESIYITSENCVGDDAESISITNVNITCDTLYIDATNDDSKLNFSNVDITADKVIIYCSTISSNSVSNYIAFSNNCSITTNTIEYKTSATSSTNNGLSSYVTSNVSVSINRTYNVADLVLPARNIPSFVSAADQLEATTVNNTSYNFTAATVSTADVTYQVYELSSNKSSYTFSASNFTGYSDEKPIVVVVPDGVDVTLSTQISTNGVYFYLKGSATLTCETDCTIRVYSEAVANIDGFNSSALKEIKSSLTTDSSVVDLADAIDGKSDSILKGYQDYIFDLIIVIQNSSGSLITENGKEIEGTVTCAVMKNVDPTNTNSGGSSGVEIEYVYSSHLGDQTIDSSDWSTFVENYYTFSVDVFTKEE